MITILANPYLGVLGGQKYKMLAVLVIELMSIQLDKN